MHTNVASLVKYARQMIDKLELREFHTEKRFPALVANSLYNMLSLLQERIDPLDELYMRRLLDSIFEILIQTVYPHFFGSLRQSVFSWKAKNYEKLRMQIPAATYDMEIMRTRILISILARSFQGLDDSLSNCFFDRMGNMVECDKLVVEKKAPPDLVIPSLYNACTASKVLQTYLETKVEKYRTTAVDYCRRIGLFLSDYINQWESIEVKDNPALLCYIFSSLNSATNLALGDPAVAAAVSRLQQYLEEYSSDIRFAGLSWMCVNLHSLSPSLFQKYSRLLLSQVSLDPKVPKQDLPSLVSALAFSVPPGEVLHFGFPVEFEKVDFDWLCRVLFPKYLEISEVDIDVAEIKRMQTMDDPQIRRALTHILKQSQAIPEHVKNELELEGRKPHAGAEISDFEIPLKMDGQNFYACFVIKSGREIRTDTVPDHVMSQILKPFLSFQHCAVVFVTAKKRSLSLLGYIEKASAKYPAPILTIEESNLAKLLKIYGQL